MTTTFIRPEDNDSTGKSYSVNVVYLWTNKIEAVSPYSRITHLQGDYAVDSLVDPPEHKYRHGDRQKVFLALSHLAGKLVGKDNCFVWRYVCNSGTSYIATLRCPPTTAQYLGSPHVKKPEILWWWEQVHGSKGTQLYHFFCARTISTHIDFVYLSCLVRRWFKVQYILQVDINILSESAWHIPASARWLSHRN